MKPTTQLTKNFNLIEFACKDGTPVPEKYHANAKKLAENLQIIRDETGAAIYINSAYRHTAYNKKIGGAKNSQHLTCSAADIVSKELSPVQLRNMIRRLIREKKLHNGGLGSYRTFTHYDVRKRPARW